MSVLVPKVALLLSLLAIVSAKTYCVTTERPNGTNCSEASGLYYITLSQYAANQRNYVDSNTTLILQPGNHNLKVSIHFSNVTSVAILSAKNTDPSAISCAQSVRFTFDTIKNVTIRGVMFNGCVNNTITSVQNFTLDTCTMNGNGYDGSGVVLKNATFVSVIDCTFSNNTGTCDGGDRFGGAISAWNVTYIFISRSTFASNDLLYRDTSNAINNSYILTNTDCCGGAIHSVKGKLVLNGNIFENNKFNLTPADMDHDHRFDLLVLVGGGALCVSGSRVSINNTTFIGNTVTGIQHGKGGALLVKHSNISMFNNSFIKNSVDGHGGAISLLSSNLTSTDKLMIQNNKAKHGAVALFAFDSKIYLSGSTIVSGNNACSSQSTRGGGLTLYQSYIMLAGTYSFTKNSASQGGGIYLSASNLFSSGLANISYNKADESGGGIYADESKLRFNGNTTIHGNKADKSGGGIHAISSSTHVIGSATTIYSGDSNNIMIQSYGSLRFINNHANTYGGGMTLEANSKLYVFKKNIDSEQPFNNNVSGSVSTYWVHLDFTGNSAEYGGALYVDDDTNFGNCQNTLMSQYHLHLDLTRSRECFVQVFTNILHTLEDSTNVRNINFTDNTATKAGGILFGGLLDRCSVSTFAEVLWKYYSLATNNASAKNYFLNITNVQQKDFSSPLRISSKPVRVCFCVENKPNCNSSYHPHFPKTYRGKNITVPLVVVDHVDNIIPNATVHALVLQENTGSVGKGESEQTTGVKCTKLQYHVYSSNLSDSAEVQLYAKGPCKNAGISVASFTVNFIDCPLGFEFEEAEQKCICDSALKGYISDCNIDTVSVIRKNNAWFSFKKPRDSYPHVYKIYPHCPYDYCKSNANISVNLNDENEVDKMCAFNRSGTLCGRCDSSDNLSVVFGSSNCKQCSNNWPTLLILFAIIIVGIVLVLFLLICNLTVTVGTINGLIFYSDIIVIDPATFLPFDKPNFFTIFIAWLNLDLGFEACFYDGMDGYAKVWLQLAFPLYIITLVVLIILTAQYSYKFAHLLRRGNRNPISILATLIFLSHAKFTQIIITALSPATVEYTNGLKTEAVWKFDGNVSYAKRKHIPLIVIATLIAILGTAFTTVLFLWQWLMRSPKKWRIMKWTANSKLIAFMEVYQAPFHQKHRYWFGLLLLVRIVLYVAAAANISSDPSINLCCVIVAIAGLYLFQYNAVAHTKGGRVYKKRAPQIFENIFTLNLLMITAISTTLLNNKDSRATVAKISISISFVTFIAILLYHTIAFTPLSSMVLHSWRMVIQNLKKKKQKPTNELVNINEYIRPLIQDGIPETVVDCRDLPRYADSLLVQSESPHERKRECDDEKLHVKSCQFSRSLTQ